MSDKRISELVNLTSLAADDEFVVVDSDANATKRITASNLSKFPSDITIPNGGTIGSASDADAITIDASGNVALSQALQLGDSTAISKLGADIYRLTANASSNGKLTSWERVDEPDSATLGTGVTLSSGDFSVPNEGIWLVLITLNFRLTGDNFIAARLYVNAEQVNILQGFENDTADTEADHSDAQILNLNNTDNLYIEISSAGSNAQVVGDSNLNRSTIAFIRLGDA